MKTTRRSFLSAAAALSALLFAPVARAAVVEPVAAAPPDPAPDQVPADVWVHAPHHKATRSVQHIGWTAAGEKVHAIARPNPYGSYDVAIEIFPGRDFLRVAPWSALVFVGRVPEKEGKMPFRKLRLSGRILGLVFGEPLTAEQLRARGNGLTLLPPRRGGHI